MLPTLNTAEEIEARYAVLSSLPLPSGVPDDALTPISIPPPYSLHDFIGTMSGVSLLYPKHMPSERSLQLLRYQYVDITPLYCFTQRIHAGWATIASSNNRRRHGARTAKSTATTWRLFSSAAPIRGSAQPTDGLLSTLMRRWMLTQVSRSIIPSGDSCTPSTECFFNKDGKWYYAGIYKSFRLEDLCTQEWECLSTEVCPDLAALPQFCHITPLHHPADLAGAHQGDARGAQEHVPAELLRD